MKKLRTYVIPVSALCVALAANCLFLILGSTLSVFAMGGRPGGLPNSQIVDPPTFKQDGTGCQGSPSDFDTKPRTDPNFMSGKAHYRVLTINPTGGGQCDHLSWDIHKTVPKAAMNSCLFFMHLRDKDSSAGINLQFLDKGGHQIVPEQHQEAPGPFRAKVKGVNTVQADFGVGVDPNEKVDIGILFVDCNSNNSGVS